MAILELHEISYSFKIDGHAVPVLSNVDFCIHRGELVAIQGPSGSGKSTLLYLMGCLLKLQAGHLRIDGHDISDLSDEDLAAFRNQKIGLIFQQFHLLPKTKVVENIMLPTVYPCGGAKKNDLSQQKAMHLAATFGLDERLEHFPNQLSGGQQQRVAIARALMNDPSIILADEPTGNLDSKSTAQILQVLKNLSSQGKTVVIITHDSEVAKQCSRVFHIKDGSITHSRGAPTDPFEQKREPSERTGKTVGAAAVEKVGAVGAVGAAANFVGYIRMGQALLPLAVENLLRNKSRTALNMLGVIIGVAAVLAMLTLGQFTKRKILDSYAELGAHALEFRGYPNWKLKATDAVSVMFDFFDWERDLVAIKKVFPQITAMSPVLTSFGGAVSFGGKMIDQDVWLKGVHPDVLPITRSELLAGHNFSRHHLENKSAVCILGYEIAERLFLNSLPLGQVVNIDQRENSFGCRVIGVLKFKTSNNEWNKANLNILLPFTYLQVTSSREWESQIRHVLLQLEPNSDIEKTGQAIRTYFEMKYGKSGRFRVDSDSVLLAQMRKFLNLFTVLLATIALISLVVGGVGITNMMLVSVSERFREIGLRKALGATDKSIRIQFLMESIVICTAAGFIGIVMGFIVYQSIIFGASVVIAKLSFEWIVDWGALGLALGSIVIVGVLSGFFPALKAEGLQVQEALRAE